MTITLSALQKQRRDTAANWTAENPTLLAGELGLESDTGYWKVGDGSTAWTSLAYVSGLGGEIPVSRLADGAARQLLQTDAAGTGVEWTSNVDVPGTLDVTSTATFDSIARHPLGSAAAPTLTFTGDTNTGIYSPGADQVAVATNGVGRLFVDASGNVGVGTALPGNFDADANNLVIAAAGANVGLTFDADTTASSNIYFADGSTGDNLKRGQISYNHNGDYMAFATNASERLRITSAGRVGIGTSSPDALLEIEDSTGGTSFSIHNTGTSGRQYILQSTSSAASIGGGKFAIYDGDAPAHRFVIDSSGRVGIGTTSPSVILETNVASGSNEFRQSVAGVTRGQLIASATDQTFANSGTGSQVFYNTGSERARIDASGRLLVGTSTARTVEWSYGDAGTPKLQVEGDGGASSQILITDTRSDGRNPSLAFAKTRNGAIVTSGDVLGSLSFFGDDGVDTRTWGGRITCEVDGTPGANDMPGRLVFSTTADGAASPTERMRITNGGTVDINTSDGSSPIVANRGFVRLYGAGTGDGSYFESYGGVCAYMNRGVNDGELIQFRQAGTPEGSVSVSGTTVSYNGAHLSRWSQLPSGAQRTEILRGSVLSNLDEMCEWGEEDNEQLNRMKVSDIEGDKNVSGVFQAWDDDDDTYTDDFYCAMTGDFIIRIGDGVTVERGDLLMSAGDGTAKPQDDDIVRSKTLAKVTSTNVSCTYDDGSYCVPCVLMAC